MQHNPDEIVVENIKMIHLENMNPEHLWIGIYGQDGKIYHLNIGIKDSELSYYWSEES